MLQTSWKITTRTDNKVKKQLDENKRIKKKLSTYIVSKYACQKTFHLSCTQSSTSIAQIESEQHAQMETENLHTGQCCL